MKYIILAILTIISTLSAAEFNSREVRVAKHNFTKKMADLDKKVAMYHGKYRKDYIKSLKAALKMVMQAGDLTEANKINAEIKRIEDGVVEKAKVKVAYPLWILGRHKTTYNAPELSTQHNFITFHANHTATMEVYINKALVGTHELGWIYTKTNNTLHMIWEGTSQIKTGSRTTYTVYNESRTMKFTTDLNKLIVRKLTVTPAVREE